MNRPGQVAEWDALIADVLVTPDVLGLADHGDYLEAHLLHSHYDYLEQGQALIVKLGVPIRGMGRRSRHAFPGGPTLCDFAGWVRVGDLPPHFDVLLEGADEDMCQREATRLADEWQAMVYVHNEHVVVAPVGPGYRVVPVVFDAKRRDVSSSSGWRWQCSQTLQHQRLALQMVEGWLGGWGFLLISLEDGGQLLNDVRVVRASQLVPGTSVDLRECPSVKLGLSRCDWLPVVQEMYDAE